jgi:hypothetical protein
MVVPMLVIFYSFIVELTLQIHLLLSALSTASNNQILFMYIQRGISDAESVDQLWNELVSNSEVLFPHVAAEQIMNRAGCLATRGNIVLSSVIARAIN